MKKLFIILTVVSAFACKSKKNIPDVSSIQIEVKTERFEKDFFLMDSTHIAASLDTLNEKYPSFLRDYLYNILGALPQPDSVVRYVGLFKKDYQNVYDASQKKDRFFRYL